MPPLLVEGLHLAAIGMGMVFLFLTLLVLATMAMSRLVGGDADTAAATTAKTTKARTPPGAPQSRKLAAIAAAIHRHRSRR